MTIQAPQSELEATPRQGRRPSQQRGRDRVERILSVATDLIARSGSDALRMSEVAEQAGISIGSLYQYFPDKGAIMRELAERFNEVGRVCIIEGLESIHTVADLRVGLAELLDGYYQMYLDAPVIADIYSGTRADRKLKEIEIDDGRQNAALLLATLKRIWPERDEAQLATSSLLFMELGTAAVRLAISVPRAEGDALMAEYKRLVDSQYALESESGA